VNEPSPTQDGAGQGRPGATTGVFRGVGVALVTIFGDDGEILHQMDLSRQSPGLILYEHRHLDKHLRSQCVRLLERAGYLVTQVNKGDTIASRIGPPGF